MSTHKDLSGTTYTSPDGKTAGDGVQVKIHTINGPVSGRMVGGYVVTDK